MSDDESLTSTSSDEESDTDEMPIAKLKGWRRLLALLDKENSEVISTMTNVLADYPEFASLRIYGPKSFKFRIFQWYPDVYEGARFYPLFILVSRGANLEAVKKVHELAPQALEATTIMTLHHYDTFFNLELAATGEPKPSVLVYLIEECPELVSCLGEQEVQSILENLSRNPYDEGELPFLKCFLSNLLDNAPVTYDFDRLQQICSFDGLSKDIIDRVAYYAQDSVSHRLSHLHVLKNVSKGYVKALVIVMPRITELELPRHYEGPVGEVFPSLTRSIANNGTHLRILKLSLPSILMNDSKDARQSVCSLAANLLQLEHLELHCPWKPNGVYDNLMLQDLVKGIEHRRSPIASLELSGFLLAGIFQDLVSLLLSPNGATKLTLSGCSLEGDFPFTSVASSAARNGASLKGLTVQYGYIPSDSLLALITLLSQLPTLEMVELSTFDSHLNSDICCEHILSLVQQSKQLRSLTLRRFPEVYLDRLWDILRPDDHSLEELIFEVLPEKCRTGRADNHEQFITSFEPGLAELLQTNTTLGLCLFGQSNRLCYPNRTPQRHARCREINYLLALNALGRKKARDCSVAGLVKLLARPNEDFFVSGLLQHPEYDIIEDGDMEKYFDDDGNLILIEEDAVIIGLLFGLLQQNPDSWAKSGGNRSNQQRPTKRPRVLPL
ncbi:expressed unknown protein [Seminavis robusta]|uniref:Uncharacterized protein n=1 Tax=Seminavis robusta TaxID=568900 RepID=A0A9N8HBE1_9STRA|nr:expressed unknown protein [Seminavis robusta]|eukprot:Sro358_g125850.1 n/a (671) ;mRNA; r:28284-30296